MHFPHPSRGKKMNATHHSISMWADGRDKIMKESERCGQRLLLAAIRIGEARNKRDREVEEYFEASEEYEAAREEYCKIMEE